MYKIIYGDSANILSILPKCSVQLIYIDPPFNTGRKRIYTRVQTKSTQDKGDRVGFQGKNFNTEVISCNKYNDSFDDYIPWLSNFVKNAYQLLTPDGSFFLHLDWREVHYAKVMVDEIFGRDSFINEIIWAYDYGARSRKKWPAKHDTLLWYAKNPKDYTFNFEQSDRIPYMAPTLVTPEKAKLGKTPTDVWWNTIVPTNSKERTGYPTQKPLGILNRIVKMHSYPGDLILDFFAGSGTTGYAAAQNNRNFILIDNNLEAIKIMTSRLEKWCPEVVYQEVCKEKEEKYVGIARKRLEESTGE